MIRIQKGRSLLAPPHTHILPQPPRFLLLLQMLLAPPSGQLAWNLGMAPPGTLLSPTHERLKVRGDFVLGPHGKTLHPPSCAPSAPTFLGAGGMGSQGGAGPRRLLRSQDQGHCPSSPPLPSGHWATASGPCSAHLCPPSSPNWTHLPVRQSSSLRILPWSCQPRCQATALTGVSLQQLQK